ncbi:protein pbn1 [Niveomyces insectorum RCEF 264]|uniref:Protein PBN1 n=1 Tax=Niveomyces insectorum RCEF 264 TaxID=1081102 RepID=A0A162J9P7_9HYPO|nr:protein pbn1 [Niveomyces insectorum RCEF 264]
MRQRTTFFHRPQSPVDPALLHLTDAALTGPVVQAVREDRVTLALDELPAELRAFLGDDVQRLHVRWAGARADDEPVSPLFARLAPGLHVFYTPSRRNTVQNDREYLPTLKRQKSTGADVSVAFKKSFVDLGDNRRPHSAALQYYAPVHNLSAFAAYAQAAWCATGDGSTCAFAAADALDRARALDLSYDPDLGTLKITVQWPLAERPLAVASVPGARIEVGVLGADAPPTLGPHELGMAGHIAVLGQDEHLSPVMFAFPSRHRQAADGAAAFAATFVQPTGLHPTLHLRLASGPPPRSGSGSDNSGAASTCKLHTYLTLPRHIFADQYQLGDPLFLASKNLTALRHITEPVDLEAPDYAVPSWGAAALVELAPPFVPSQSTWTAEIPLHLRYLLPADGGYRSVDVPYPVVFWACPAGVEDTSFATNPFDRTNLGYDGLFDEETEFWHVRPDPSLGASPSPSSDHAASTDHLINFIRVPVLDSAKSQWVNAGTSVTILLGFSWVLWKLLSVYRRTGYGRAPPLVAAKSAKKTQ